MNIKKMKIKKILPAFALLIIALAGCQDKATQASSEVPIDVTTAVAENPNGKGYFNASGMIQADRSATISTRFMGYVSKVNVKIGDKVQKGQLLLKINSDELEAKMAQANAGLAQAKTQLEIAEKDYNRYVKLYEQKSASEKELENMTMQYEMAKAQYEQARQMQNEIDANMAYSNIRSPFSGIITAKSIEEGDLASPGQMLLQLEAPGKFIATAMVPESEIGNVSKGDSVRVILKSSQAELSGQISELSRSSVSSGGQYLVKITLGDVEDQALYSGMFTTTVFEVEREQMSPILIERSALVRRGELNGIFTVSASNTAILRWVKLGLTHGNRVEVLSGLTEGEKYILSAEGKLYNGAAINEKQ